MKIKKTLISIAYSAHILYYLFITTRIIFKYC